MRACDGYLRTVAGLVDRAIELSELLERGGFKAFKPGFDDKRNRGDRYWIAWCETVKESLAKRHILVDGKPKTVGYVSHVLPDIYRSVGITAEDIARKTPRLLFEKLAQVGDNEAPITSVTDTVMESISDFRQRESANSLSRTRLDEVSSAKRAEYFLESMLGRRGYRVLSKETSFSKQVLSRRLGSELYIELAVPRKGPVKDDHLPRNFPMIVRPRFEFEWLKGGTYYQTINSDWLLPVSIHAILPGFLAAYAYPMNWDYVVRGLEAYCALYELIEDQLVGTAESAARVLSEVD